MAIRRERYSETEIVCPFYLSKNEGNNCATIMCEGYSEDTKITTRFRTVNSREKHLGTYCTYIYRYNRCPVYKLIYNEKYSDEVIHNGR